MAGTNVSFVTRAEGCIVPAHCVHLLHKNLLSLTRDNILLDNGPLLKNLIKSNFSVIVR
jgi:hypothetical protein